MRLAAQLEETAAVKEQLAAATTSPFQLALADGNPSAVHRSRNLPHLVNQSGWRNHPGHRSGGLHVDELFLTATELPPELLSGFPGWEPPMQILTALTYLVDVDAALCPTIVVACAPPPRPPDVDVGSVCMRGACAVGAGAATARCGRRGPTSAAGSGMPRAQSSPTRETPSSSAP